MLEDFVPDSFVEFEEKVVVVLGVRDHFGAGHQLSVRCESGEWHARVAGTIQLTPQNQSGNGGIRTCRTHSGASHNHSRNARTAQVTSTLRPTYRRA